MINYDIALFLFPIITALVQVIKQFVVDKSWHPVIAIALGLILSAIVGGTLPRIVFVGLIAGLSACGLYDLKGLFKKWSKVQAP